MAKIAMKFGGTSVADIERIRHVATLVKRERDRGNQVAVVVSAMAGETNKLLGWVNEIARPTGSNARPIPEPSEQDVVVAAGEQITSGLLAVALNAMGVPARSWMGWQIPLRTSAVHTHARIEGMDADLMNESLAKGRGGPSSPAIRAWRRMSVSPPWAAAARTRRRWRWRRG